MQIREGVVNVGDDAEIPLVGELVVEPADDVELGATMLGGLTGTSKNLVS
jgi:hypothetical protein